jgi:hypothetical protein
VQTEIKFFQYNPFSSKVDAVSLLIFILLKSEVILCRLGTVQQAILRLKILHSSLLGTFCSFLLIREAEVKILHHYLVFPLLPFKYQLTRLLCG